MLVAVIGTGEMHTFICQVLPSLRTEKKSKKNPEQHCVSAMLRHVLVLYGLDAESDVKKSMSGWRSQIRKEPCGPLGPLGMEKQHRTPVSNC